MASPALLASVSMALLPHAVPLDARRLHVTRPALRCSSPAMLDPASAWAAYNSALVTDPLVTKAISAGVIIGAGDAAAQLVEGSKSGKAFDPLRYARWAFFGLVLQVSAHVAAPALGVRCAVRLLRVPWLSVQVWGGGGAASEDRVVREALARLRAALALLRAREA